MNDPQRILLVEDEFDIADMLRFFFEGAGYAFLHAADGADALTLARQHQPHLILMDSDLPDMTGVAICQKLREQLSTAHIPVIFLTRHTEHSNLLSALEAGADDFLGKPFDPAELMLRVKNVLRLAEREKRVPSPTLQDSSRALPGRSTTRERLAEVRQNPTLSVIEVMLSNSLPYRQRYGRDQVYAVEQDVQDMILWALAQAEIPNNFAGALDHAHVVIILPRRYARSFAERIEAMFQLRARGYYHETDWQRGYLDLHGIRYPLLSLTCQVHVEESAARAS